jgi:hypothetical protein
VEIWKSIKDFENYEISNLSRVRSNKKGNWNILQPSPITAGYLAVWLTNNNNRKLFTVHRLVATAFCVKNNPDDVVNHINGNKKDNSPDNLEWISYSENNKHAYRTGLKQSRLGKNISNNKKVYMYDTNMNLLKVFNSGRDASTFKNCSTATMSNKCKGNMMYKGNIFSHQLLSFGN